MVALRDPGFKPRLTSYKQATPLPTVSSFWASPADFDPGILLAVSDPRWHAEGAQTDSPVCLRLAQLAAGSSWQSPCAKHTGLVAHQGVNSQPCHSGRRLQVWGAQFPFQVDQAWETISIFSKLPQAPPPHPRWTHEGARSNVSEWHHCLGAPLSTAHQ